MSASVVMSVCHWMKPAVTESTDDDILFTD